MNCSHRQARQACNRLRSPPSSRPVAVPHGSETSQRPQNSPDRRTHKQAYFEIRGQINDKSLSKHVPAQNAPVTNQGPETLCSEVALRTAWPLRYRARLAGLEQRCLEWIRASL